LDFVLRKKLSFVFGGSGEKFFLALTGGESDVASAQGMGNGSQRFMYDFLSTVANV
jgi:hypothetical protein